MQRIYVSKTGLENLKSRLESLNNQLIKIRKEKTTAFELSGDGWHDNPEYNRLLQEENSVSNQYSELKQIISQAEIYDTLLTERDTTKVRLGSIVKVSRINLHTKEEEKNIWEIVGYEETDVENRKIAYNSPIAVAIMGLEEGEINHALNLKKERLEYEVLRLYKDWNEVNN